jgi:hypothetical protein
MKKQHLLILGSVVAVIGAAAAVSVAATTICKGQTATIVGTNGNDVLVGTTGDDVIAGLGGNDRIRGKGGDDVICGGSGNDDILGQAGDDLLVGGKGGDDLSGGGGADQVFGGRGRDMLNGDNGNDILKGGAGNDALDGGSGRDTANGGSGNDECSAETETACESSAASGSDDPSAGYNLYAPLRTTTAYLVDNDGDVVHTWDTELTPGNSLYLLEDGTLLYTGGARNSTFQTGGAGGVVQLIDWDGEVLWEYTYSSNTHLQHHDAEMLPNGNVLMIAWEMVTQSEAISAGRDPSLLRDGDLWTLHVIEVEPTGASGGNIVWGWHVMDHLVQDNDPTKDNYGVVADHPELVDFNYLKRNQADWLHANSIDYNAELDQIVLSIHAFDEIWIIDHSTTTAEAAGHTDGDSGMGGDLLYRWGNPQTYDAGTNADKRLFSQHDAEWIADGLSGEGNILIYNNGMQRPEGNYSSVVEIVTPVRADGTYTLFGSAYGPNEPVWTYVADPATSFYSQNISGSQRLPNGNTLITEGDDGFVFEVTPSGDVVWQYDVSGAVFRVDRYAPDYPGFDGTPLDDR